MKTHFTLLIFWFLAISSHSLPQSSFGNKVRIHYKDGLSQPLDNIVIRFYNDPAVTTSENSYYDVRSLNSGAYLASMKNDVGFAIQTRPLNFNIDTVRLKVISNVAGNFSLSFTEYNDFLAAKEIILMDSYTGLQQEIKSNPAYNFSITADPQSQGTNRFQLVFISAPLVLRCPGNIVVNNLPGRDGAYVGFEPQTFIRSLAFYLNYSHLPGTYFSIGTTQVKIFLSDVYGNADSCIFLITVKDVEPPLFNSVNTLYLNSDSNDCGHRFLLTAPVANDNSGSVSVSGTRSDGVDLYELFPAGSTIITWMATDGSGNATSMLQTVNVADNKVPVITLPTWQTNYSPNSNTCKYLVNSNEFDATASDNCGVSTVKNNRNNTNTLSGELLPLGKTVVLWTAVDVSGNASTIQQEIHISDNVAPVVNGIATVTQFSNSAGCTYTVNSSQFDPLVSDCQGFLLLNNRNNTSSLNGEKLVIGTHNINWTATDTDGNVTTWDQQINIVSGVTASIPDAYAYPKGARSNTVYVGYSSAAFLQYASNVPLGTYTYQWSVTGNLLISGSATGSVVKVGYAVAGTGTGTLSLTVKNIFGCSFIVQKAIMISDIRCGNKKDKVTLCSPTGNQSCIVNNSSIASSLTNGYFLGSCAPVSGRDIIMNETEKEPFAIIFPNPGNGLVRLKLSNYPAGRMELKVVDVLGKTIAVKNIIVDKNIYLDELDLSANPSGIYNILLIGDKVMKTIKLVIRK